MSTVKKTSAVLLLFLLLAVFLCGCMITHGVFIGIRRSSTDTSLEASFKSFDGSLARRLKLQSGDMITFRFESDNVLRPVVVYHGEEIFMITDGGVFTAPENGTYDFAVKGTAEDGWFSLTWAVE